MLCQSKEVWSMRAWGVAALSLLAVLLATLASVGADANLVVFEGRHVQVTDYLYRLTLEPPRGSLEAVIALLPAVDQPWYHVSIEEQSLAAEPDWRLRRDTEDGDRGGHVTLMWSGAGDTVVVERRVRATTTAVYGAMALPDPFPVPSGTIPWSCQDALRAPDRSQSNDRTVQAIAESVTAGSPTQLDAVVRLLGWIRREVVYACSKDLCDPVYRTDALFTLEKKKGNCVSYANLAIALLRAAGIPVVEVSGFVADRSTSRACHAWIAAYFPSTGWIEFESADWMPAYGDVPITFLMPQHLTIHRGEQKGISRAPFSEEHEAVYEILERPQERTHVRATANGPVAWVLTVRSPVYEDASLQLAIRDLPAGWRVVLSEDALRIGENDVSRSVDLLVTAIPPSGAAPGTVGRFSVVGTHDGESIGEVDFEVTVGP
jgi:hypothetical protein